MGATRKKVPVIAYVDVTNKVARRARQGLERAINRLGNSVEFSYRFFPDPNSSKEDSLNAAKAVIAAELQNSLEDMLECLGLHEGDFDDQTIIGLAKTLELDIPTFLEDYNSEQTKVRIEASQLELEKIGVKMVPAITIDGKIYNGPWDEYAVMEAVENHGTKHVETAVDSFFSWGASAAFILLLSTLMALILVNVDSGFYELYEYIKHLDFGVLLGNHRFDEPLEVWINDGLMAVFFFLIGLEIKREIVAGELSTLDKALMPIIGALGGMLVPILFYLLVNYGGDGLHGWGVPMATDIAFTLGLMALLGSRVSTSLKIFISALAVADDLGAIAVIAMFYGHGFHLMEFGVAVLILIIMDVLNYKKVYNTSVYIFLGLFLWYFIFQSGLHATLAGVLTAVFIPFRRSGDVLGVASQTQVIFEQEILNIEDNKTSDTVIRSDALRSINKAIDRLREPSYYLEHSLEKWVNYLVLPVFAFFNTGILISGTEGLVSSLLAPINLGILLGLCIGKPAGIFIFCWLADKIGLAHLSPAISWRDLLGAGCLAGVGFTMSIVVASSAFQGDTLDQAKLSILIASLVASIVGLGVLSYPKKERNCERT
ncbi:MAG: Na+/H+ antiporter NhaA [Bacteroidota bacterium]